MLEPNLIAARPERGPAERAPAERAPAERAPAERTQSTIVRSGGLNFVPVSEGEANRPEGSGQEVLRLRQNEKGLRRNRETLPILPAVFMMEGIEYSGVG